MNKSSQYILSKIIEKAEKLRRFGFEKHIQSTGLGLKGSKNEDGTWKIEMGIPDEKERDAFILTFRLFYQKNDPISLFNLDKICGDQSLSAEFRCNILKIRDQFLTFLNNSSEYTFELFEGHPTRRDMLEVFFYGVLLHTDNLPYEEKYELWTRDEIRRNLFEQEIAGFLLNILRFIYVLESNCRKELQDSENSFPENLIF